MKKILIGLLITACVTGLAAPARSVAAGTATAAVQEPMRPAGDITLTAGTDQGPARQSITIPTAWGLHGAVQSEIYRLEAGAGVLNIRLGGGDAGEPVRIVLEDLAGGEFLLDKSLYGDELGASVTLPRAGIYNLLLAPNLTPSVTIDAMNLVVATETPALRLPPMKPYETHNEPFTFAPVLLGSAATATVKVTVNGQVLSSGPAAPVTIDPAALGDGLYALNVRAEGKGGNQGLSARSFLVDREAAFGDVGAGHWARPYVEVMHHLGVVNGRNAGSFAPGESVTRAEFAKLMALTLGLQPSDQPGGPAFADVAPDSWARPYILALAARSLIRGEVVGDQAYFRPERTITRAEAATILGRVLGVDDAHGDAVIIGFEDVDAIPAWARPAVAMLSEAKWINGFPDGHYYPGHNLQRDQAARVLANFLGM